MTQALQHLWLHLSASLLDEFYRFAVKLVFLGDLKVAFQEFLITPFL